MSLPPIPALHRTAVRLLTFAFLAVVFVWTTLTPGFRGPDEPQHVNSVLRVAKGGGWPTPGDAYLSPLINNAADQAGLITNDCYVTLQCLTSLARGDNPWSGSPFLDQQVPKRQDRGTFDDLSQPLPRVTVQDQMTQHPPLYYTILAGVVKVTGAQDWQWDSVLLLLRMITALMVAPLISLTHRAALLISQSPRLALVTATTLIGIPQLAHIGGVVSNDPLTITLCAVVTYLCTRVMAQDRRWRTLVTIGVALGLAGLTKGTALPFVFVTGLTLLFSADTVVRVRTRLVQTGVVMAVALASGMWWWAVNLIVHGTVQPAGSTNEVASWGDKDPTLWKLATAMWKNVPRSFWGEFGWLEVPIAWWIYTALTIIGLVLLVLAAVQRSVPRRNLTILLSAPITMMLILIAGSWEHFVTTGLIAGIQGRYFFPTIPILTMTAMIGARVVFRSARARTVAGFAAVLCSIAMACYGLILAFMAFYVTDGTAMSHGIEVLLQHAPVSATWIAVSWSLSGTLMLSALLTLLPALLSTSTPEDCRATARQDDRAHPSTARTTVEAAWLRLRRATSARSTPSLVHQAIRLAPLAVLAAAGPLAYSFASPPFSTHTETAQIDYAWQLWHGTLPISDLGVTLTSEVGSIPATQLAATQPPFFFALLAPIVGPLVDAGHSSLAGYGARSVVLIICIAVVLCTKWSIRQMAPNPHLAPTVAAIVSALGLWFMRVGGTVDNTMLGLLTIVLGLGLVARMMRTNTYQRSLAGFTLCLIVASLTQATAALALTVALVALALHAALNERASARQWGSLLARPLALAAIASTWFYLRTWMLTAGTPQPSSTSSATPITSDWFWSGVLQQFVGTPGLRPGADFLIFIIPMALGLFSAFQIFKQPHGSTMHAVPYLVGLAAVLLVGALTAAALTADPNAYVGSSLLILLPVFAALIALGFARLGNAALTVIVAWVSFRLVDTFFDVRSALLTTPLNTARPSLAWACYALLAISAAASLWTIRKPSVRPLPSLVEAIADHPHADRSERPNHIAN